MPPRMTHDRRTQGREALAEADARLGEFSRKFSESKRKPGNIWTVHDGATVTVFRKDWAFAWSVTGPGGATDYSPGTYPTQAEALEALAWHLGVVQGH